MNSSDGYDSEDSVYKPGKQFSGPKVVALRDALGDRDPFYSGICTLPYHQRLLYYFHDDLSRRIDLSRAGADDLDALYRACKPAEFGRNGENVFDESYRKAGKMDLTSFATLFDPRSLRISEQVSRALLTQSYATAMDMELYKLNVYGPGDFFKAHKDTPRGQDMFGSLVVVLPTSHEGGQFILRQGEKEWSLDFADKFKTLTEPSACFVAFYGDVEHEVRPVTSGYRITLTYNLYRRPVNPSTSHILTPFHVTVKQALVDLVNDKSKLQNGGYLGFGLVHEYVHTGRNLIEPLLDQLKGSDRVLADVCDDLGLRYCLRLFYRGIIRFDTPLHLITTKELDVPCELGYYESTPYEYLDQALKGLTIDEAEGVILVGGRSPYESDILNPRFYRTPATEVLEITLMKSSVNVKNMFMAYGNERYQDHFYGTACMLIAVEPAESRDMVGL